MSKPDGQITQGSIAEFMRKRTQLVGFEFGLNKHTQYAIEFVDNALDAIESFHWKELKKYPDSQAFLLKDDMILENFSYLMGGVTPEDIERVEAEAKEKKLDDEGHELSDEGEVIVVAPEESVPADDTLILEEKPETEPTSQETHDDEEAMQLRSLQKREKELELEVQLIMDSLNAFLEPVQPLLEREPFVIIRLTESEAPAVYKEISKDSKDVYQYTFEIFDNGTGMSPQDLEKFGKYLASSKSQKLKQTRGSQGFGSPSAFSDAQNTTGQPVTVISKHSKHIYGICSEFFTTSKNNKEYVVPPTEVETTFSHGTYVKLTYLNVKYKRGYVDDYINLTALTNPHVSLLLIDPMGEELVHPRRVKAFPAEPTYALPHPSSVNIGDFQDLLRSSENITVSAFLQENFVRLSGSVAKKIIEEAEADLQATLKILNVGDFYISHCSHTQEPIYLMRFEKRIFGRNKKAYDKLIPYLLDAESDKEKYWEIITQYNSILREIEKLQRKIQGKEKEWNKEEDKKKIKEFEKEIKEITTEMNSQFKILEELRKKLTATVKSFSLTNEITDDKIVDKVGETVQEITLSKARPKNLSQKQVESLFKAFKNQKYMNPPTDTAIPIGSSVLETTMIKEFKLNLSHRTDLFGDYRSELDPLKPEEHSTLSPRILIKFNKPEYFQEDSNWKTTRPIPENLSIDNYTDLASALDLLQTNDDDFVAAHTRQPTSGKGLAFVVEAVAVLSPKVPAPKQANQALMRFVNRTPKLRDNSDCAIWKAVASVNWKNYKIDVFDNGIPKGEIRLLVNVAGPYVHLMFKSQSKNALAEDDVLMKEIKYCLEVIGRKIRNFMNKKVRRETTRKRSKTIEKYIPMFINALMGIAKNMDEYKSLKPSQLEQKLQDGLNGKYDGIAEPEDEAGSEESSEETGEEEEIEEESEDFDGEDDDRPKKRAKTAPDEDTDEVAAEPRSPVSSDEIESVEPPATKIPEEKLPSVKEEPKPLKETGKAVGKESMGLKKKEKTALIESPQKKEPAPAPVSVEKTPPADIPVKSPAPSDTGKTNIAAPRPVTDISSLLKKPATSQEKRIEPKTELKPIEKPTTVSKSSAAPESKATKKSVPAPAPKTQTQLNVAKSPSEPGKLEKPLNTTAKPQAPLVKPVSEPEKLVKPESKMKIPTNDDIIGVFKAGEWLNIRDILTRLEISDMNLARFVQVKIKTLQSEKRVIVKIEAGKTLWKLA
jgi:DNA topoisomerase VI B subunit